MDLEQLRLEYNLNKSSIVFDIGAYQGKFTRELFAKYGCRIYAFEPVKNFYDGIKNLQLQHQEISVFNLGIAPQRGTRTISVRADSSGFWLDSAEKQEAAVWSPEEVMKNLGIDRVDLMKINIEGEEYDLMDHILATNLAPRVKYFQIQFHGYGASGKEKERHDAIREGLSKTHDVMWDFPLIWESHQRRL